MTGDSPGYDAALSAATERSAEWDEVLRLALDGDYQRSVDAAEKANLLGSVHYMSDGWRDAVMDIYDTPLRLRPILMSAAVGQDSETVVLGLCTACNRAEIRASASRGSTYKRVRPPPFSGECYEWSEPKNGESATISGLRYRICGQQLADAVRVCVDLDHVRKPVSWYRMNGMAGYRELTPSRLSKIIDQMSTDWDAPHKAVNEVLQKVLTAAREVDPDDWDADPDIDLTANGVYVRRSTGEVLSVGKPPIIDGQEYLARRPLGAVWDPNARCPRFLRMLSTGGGNTAAILWAMAACLVHAPKLVRKIFLVVGPGGNGKSIVARMLGAVLGKANKISMTPDQLGETRFNRWHAVGRRAFISGEAAKDEAIGFGRKSSILPAIQILKAWTGMDDDWSDIKNEEGRSGSPDVTPFLCFNKLPDIGGEADNDAWERRAYVIEMDKQFDDSERDTSYESLPDDEDEVAGLYQILRKMAALLQAGYPFPYDEDKNSFRRAIRRRTDHTSGPPSFVTDRALEASVSMLKWSGPHGRPLIRSAWEAYVDHEIAANREYVDIAKFGQALRRMGFRSGVVSWKDAGKSKSARVWLNMAGSPPSWYAKPRLAQNDHESDDPFFAHPICMIFGIQLAGRVPVKHAVLSASCNRRAAGFSPHNLRLSTHLWTAKTCSRHQAAVLQHNPGQSVSR